MKFECLPTGLIGSNCYIIWENGEGIVIDPACDTSEIMDVADKNGIKIKYIVLTHGHMDHIYSVDELRSKTDAKVLIHENDAEKLEDFVANGAIVILGESMKLKPADEDLKDGDNFYAGGMEFEVIHTPGHTSGSICIKVENSLFSGDTLFAMGRGRTDLIDGNEMDIINSIKNKLLTLDDSVEVYPGHNRKTTIGAERKYF